MHVFHPPCKVKSPHSHFITDLYPHLASSATLLDLLSQRSPIIFKPSVLIHLCSAHSLFDICVTTSVDEHTESFQFGTITKSTTLNIAACIFRKHMLESVLGIHLKVQYLGQSICKMFSFSRYYQSFPKQLYFQCSQYKFSNLCFLQQGTRVPVAPHPLQYLVFFFFFF